MRFTLQSLVLAPVTFEHPNDFPRLHNALWAGIVGKVPGAEPPLDIDTMLDLTADADFEGIRFDGVDLLLYAPHVELDSSADDIRRLVDKVRMRRLEIGAVAAPVWRAVGGGPAVGSHDDRTRFLAQVQKSCSIAERLRLAGVRPNAAVRIDSASPVEAWYEDPQGNQKRIAETLREACKIAEDHGERLAAEGDIGCGGMHSWRLMLQLLEMVDRPQTLGFLADMADTLYYLLGCNAPEHALLPPAFNWRQEDRFEAAYTELTAALRPWTIDFHVAQSDGAAQGKGPRSQYGRHCMPDDARGKLDIPHHAGYWLRDEKGELTKCCRHICWDGCRFPNNVLRQRATWVSILRAMVAVRDKHGWSEYGR